VVYKFQFLILKFSNEDSFKGTPYRCIEMAQELR